ncbi:nuclear transport factor 2 family protein [uncultured Maribacter sp.]|uniref:nuclear transport factor 2 family protein n=1 Tax=uncultured Maribacter sp. TaxID=431308 RepID=UPI002635E1B6|nr:nuclear transport factor 2 family protein [uncultured Maribacter sp.]
MKKLRILSLLLLLLTFSCTAQTSEKTSITETITAYSDAGDTNNTNALDKLLDSNYRVVMNRLFGSKSVRVISKSEYLKKIKSKEWGGDSRLLTIENIAINGTTASAKVTFKGKKATISSILILIQEEKGNWKLINDTPTFK